MNVNAHERRTGTDEETSGLFAHEMLRLDVYSLPGEDSLVFCPECGETGEDFGQINHRIWCFHGGHEIRPGNF